MAERYFVVWQVKTEGVILPEERLPTGPTILVGLQHVVAMFGATVLAPLLMGFDPNVAIFFSGIATLIFFVVTGGRVPSYLGSSFAFIGPVLAATGAAVAAGPNPNIGLALGGIIAARALFDHRPDRDGGRPPGWIEKLMPPVVTGAIVAAIGLVLAPIAINSASGIGPGNADGTAFARWIALITVVAVGLFAVYAPGLARRIPILLGAIVGYIVYLHRGEPDGARPGDRLLQDRRGRVGRPAELRRAGVRRQGDGADRAGRDRAGRRESRAHQGDRRHDRTQPRSAISAAPSSATASPRWSRAPAAAPASPPTRRTWA